jgi:hypothetical protein
VPERGFPGEEPGGARVRLSGIMMKPGTMPTANDWSEMVLPSEITDSGSDALAAVGAQHLGFSWPLPPSALLPRPRAIDLEPNPLFGRGVGDHADDEDAVQLRRIPIPKRLLVPTTDRSSAVRTSRNRRLWADRDDADSAGYLPRSSKCPACRIPDAQPQR